MTARGNEASVTTTVATLDGIDLYVSIGDISDLHLTDDSGNEKAYNAAGALVTLATYNTTTTADAGHKKAVLTLNVGLDANKNSDFTDEGDIAPVPAATLAKFAGTYNLVLKSESDSSFDTTFSADPSSRMRIVEESNINTVYSVSEGADLTLTVVINANGTFANSTYNIWASADGSAVDKDFAGTTNNTVKGRISVKSGLTAVVI